MIGMVVRFLLLQRVCYHLTNRLPLLTNNKNQEKYAKLLFSELFSLQRVFQTGEMSPRCVYSSFPSTYVGEDFTKEFPIFKKTLSFLLACCVLFTNASWMGQAATEFPDGKPQGDGFSQGAAHSANAVYLPLLQQQASGGTMADRTVNMPYFADAVPVNQAAIFWFGKVTPSENYADVRVAYTAQEIFLRVSVLDRQLWYNTDTRSGQKTIADWDGVTVYLNIRNGQANQPVVGSYRLVVPAVPDYPTAHISVTADRGDGRAWKAGTFPFMVDHWSRGGGFNSGDISDGWAVTLHIPFSGFGLSSAPAQGANWGMAVDLSDRDNLSGPAIPIKRWPGLSGSVGSLHFGAPSAAAEAVSNSSTLVLRQGLNGVSVKDAMVGGSSICGSGLDRWSQWGNKNWSGSIFFNVQSQDDMADFPCFSKEYLSFPLSGIPAGKIISSAKLTVVHFGNAEPSQAKDSYIQVSRVTEDWDPRTITWNNAPLSVENVTGAWVHPFPTGEGNTRYSFDLTRAASDAYRAGMPLSLALYEADTAMHSGKYFRSSLMDDDARPTLEIVWGDAR